MSAAAPITVATFGELMVRLATPGHLRLAQATSLDVTYAGARRTWLVTPGRFGVPARFGSRLPDNPLGEAALAMLRSLGVDVAHVIRGGDRIGVVLS